MGVGAAQRPYGKDATVSGIPKKIRSQYREGTGMDRVMMTMSALFAGGAMLFLVLSKFQRKIWVLYIPSIIGVPLIA